MTINELAKDIHENSVAHGWWDGDRDMFETHALIHSEWSEALEEARAGRKLLWYGCKEEGYAGICDGTDCREKPEECEYRKDKPEGIAVELIDGVIRILDYYGKLEAQVMEKGGKQFEIESLYCDKNVEKVPDKITTVIATLHLYTAQAMVGSQIVRQNYICLIEAAAIAMSWVKKQGIDPLEVLLKKHEYNKGRPYKHGKLF